MEQKIAEKIKALENKKIQLIAELNATLGGITELQALLLKEPVAEKDKVETKTAQAEHKIDPKINSLPK